MGFDFSRRPLFLSGVSNARPPADGGASNVSPSADSPAEAPGVAPARPGWDTDSSDSASAGSHSERPLVRAVYAYLSSGEHQLSFHEGDTIACIGERNKGWQFGENVRTHRCGWFPAAYTELVADSSSSHGSESSAEYVSSQSNAKNA
ncbi:LIM and SH3 domain protein 1-like [Pollicipes pollicipes]|uniref:LIM and SH3 domain protein 1-like n=1 Tax=Pollicipes pollicipes TaxID=41117 RepID=UPI001884E0AD|nr:LIM and SH3 domain protein 1-like [Pollicipes pollicipes]